jgi:hypothetical protein
MSAAVQFYDRERHTMADVRVFQWNVTMQHAKTAVTAA